MKLPEEEIVSEWVEVSQERIDAFAEATGDRQWIHVNPQRAERESPYGTTIAHGLLTLSLLPRLAPKFEREGAAINYGFNRVRFVAPVPAGSSVRGRFRVASVDGNRVTWDVTVECDASTKPCCVAEWVVMYGM